MGGEGTWPKAQGGCGWHLGGMKEPRFKDETKQNFESDGNCAGCIAFFSDGGSFSVFLLTLAPHACAENG